MNNLNLSRKLAMLPRAGCFLALFLLAGWLAMMTPLRADNPPTYLFQIDSNAVPGGLEFYAVYVALDSSNSVYVSYEGSGIVKFSASGTFLTHSGRPGM